MMRRIQPIVAVALLAASCTGTAATTTTTPTDNGSEVECPTAGEPIATAKLYIEHNATDEDTGVHGLFGGEAWSQLCLWDPDGNLIFVFDPRNQLEDLTVADVFFESREPPNDEQSIDQLMAAFPEGEYLVGGFDFEGTPRSAHAVFSHDIPTEPVITSPEVAEEEAAGDVLIDPTSLTVSWEPVVETIAGEPVEITGYEVILTKVDHDDPNGLTQPIYDVHVGPDVLMLPVPEEFLESNVVYELEVLAIETSGNQTIGLGFFTTR